MTKPGNGEQAVDRERRLFVSWAVELEPKRRLLELDETQDGE